MSEIRIDTRSLELWWEKLDEAYTILRFEGRDDKDKFDAMARVAGVMSAISKWLQMTTGAEPPAPVNPKTKPEGGQGCNHDTTTSGGCQGGV